ncbi:MAG: MFS transporter [Pseudomonadota bacterium]
MNIATDSPQTRRFYGYPLAVYAFTMGFLASSFFLHSRGIFFPMWMDEFAVDKTQMSLAVSLTLFAGSCLAPFTGYCLDRFEVKRVIAVASCWLAVGYLLLQNTQSYLPFLIVLVLFQGFGWTGVGPLAQTKLMVNWFSRNRGMALGIAIMGISVAGVVMPTVATWLSETIGWRSTYLLYAAVLLVFVVPLTLIVVKQSPAEVGQYPDGDPAPQLADTGASTASAEPAPKQNVVAVYREFLTSRAFWSVVITFGLMNGVYSAMITHLPTYMSTELDYTIFEASYLLGIAGGFAIAGKLVWGWMMDHMNAKLTVMCAVASYLTSTIIFLSTENYLGLTLAAGLFGLGFGGMVPVRSVLISRLFGARKFSRVNGLLSFFLAPATFWVLITGYIADQTGTYVTAFGVWATAFVLAGCISAVIRLPNREDAVA